MEITSKLIAHTHTHTHTQIEIAFVDRKMKKMKKKKAITKEAQHKKKRECRFSLTRLQLVFEVQTSWRRKTFIPTGRPFKPHPYDMNLKKITNHYSQSQVPSNEIIGERRE